MYRNRKRLRNSLRRRSFGSRSVSQEICRVSALNAGLRHGVGIEDGRKLLLGEQLLLQNQLADGLIGAECFLRDVRRSLVADIGADCGDDADGALDHLAAVLFVCRDAHNAVVHEGLDCVAEGLDGFEEVVEDNRLKRIQLELTCLCRHGNRHIVADDVERNLVHDLGDDGVNLTRHDGGTVLLRGKVDLTEAGARSGGHEAQVVTHLGEVHGTALHDAGDHCVAVKVLRRIDGVIALHELLTGNRGHVLDDAVEVGAVRVETGADCGAAHVEGANLFLRGIKALNIAADGARVSVELLTETNRHGVLKLGAAHLNDGVELLGLFAQCLLEALQLNLCLAEQGKRCHLSAGREHVVGRLTEVHVVVRVHEAVVALHAAENLDGAVCDDLVCVHVERGTCAALNRVDNELVVKLAVDDLIAGLYDSACALLGELADLEVRNRSGLLNLCYADDELRVHLETRDVEVLVCAERLYAVIRSCRNFLFADGIVLETISFSYLRHGNPPWDCFLYCLPPV